VNPGTGSRLQRGFRCSRSSCRRGCGFDKSAGRTDIDIDMAGWGRQGAGILRRKRIGLTIMGQIVDSRGWVRNTFGDGCDDSSDSPQGSTKNDSEVNGSGACRNSLAGLHGSSMATTSTRTCIPLELVVGDGLQKSRPVIETPLSHGNTHFVRCPPARFPAPDIG